MLFRTRNQQGIQGAQLLIIQPSAKPSWRAVYLLLFAAWAQAFGQVSVLDLSFRVNMKAADGIESLVVQADGRILMGEEFTSIGGCSNSFLARLNSDGSLDASFDPPEQTDRAVSRLLQQPDRKVLVGGSFGRLLGHVQPALARLLEDGSLDAAFDTSATFTTNTIIFSLTLQDDGRLLVGYQYGSDGLGGILSRVVRVNTNGSLDPIFVCTNQISGFIFALLPQADGGVLFGGNFMSVIGSTNNALFRLEPDGRLDDTFDAGLDLSSVFSLVRQPSGQILVGGSLNRTGASNSVPLLRLNADLHWDASFQPDDFGPTGPISRGTYALLLQPDGKIIVGGCFFEVGGYWRRNIVRLTPEGHVDGCFDPGLGLGNTDQPGPVRALALQPDGRIMIGGWFVGVDTAFGQCNVARLLPRSDCNLIRVFIKGGDQTFAAATFPPGGTNYLEQSSDLKNWLTIETNPSPYIYHWNFSMSDAPQAFFRARQER